MRIRIRIPQVLVLIGVISLGAVGVAAIAQYAFDMQPCPWCVLQRFIYIVVAVLALIGAFVSGTTRRIAVDLMGTLQAAAGGDLARVKRIVKVMSLVNSTSTFTEQHLVTNGCSELLGEIFGDAGKHARSAFGVAQIPMGACVEIELIAELAA